MLYRDVNIALANELAGFCELAGVDFNRVRASANSDGEANLLLPGIGVGGHCTPVYPYFLTRESRRLGMTQRLSEAAREINDQQPARQLDRVARLWGPLRGQVVHLLGLGFRPGVKVDTFSPAYTLRDELRARGAKVTLSDPYYSSDELSALGFEAAGPEGAKVVVLNTAHPQFASPNFATCIVQQVGSHRRAPIYQAVGFEHLDAVDGLALRLAGLPTRQEHNPVSLADQGLRLAAHPRIAPVVGVGSHEDGCWFGAAVRFHVVDGFVTRSRSTGLRVHANTY